MNHCIGKQNYHLSNQTEWYGFHHISTSKDTRCSYCYRQLEELGRGMELTRLMTPTSQIDCDSIQDLSISSLEFNNFSFKILNNNKTIPYLVHPPKADFRKQGVFVIEIPEHTDYCIEINQINENKLGYGLHIFQQETDIYYTLDLSVGGKKVIINENKLMYYQGKVIVSGFETGKKNNFKFITNINNDSDKKSLYPTNNIITIKINTYKRVHSDLDDSFWCGVAIPKGNFFGSVKQDFRSFNKTKKKNIINELNVNINNTNKRKYRTYGCKTIPNTIDIPKVDHTPTNNQFELISGFSSTVQLIHVNKSNKLIDYKNSHMLKTLNEQKKMLETQKSLLYKLNELEPLHPIVTSSTQVNTNKILVTSSTQVNTNKILVNQSTQVNTNKILVNQSTQVNNKESLLYMLKKSLNETQKQTPNVSTNLIDIGSDDDLPDLINYNSDDDSIIEFNAYNEATSDEKNPLIVVPIAQLDNINIEHKLSNTLPNLPNTKLELKNINDASKLTNHDIIYKDKPKLDLLYDDFVEINFPLTKEKLL
jgi:hypothetical protein